MTILIVGGGHAGGSAASYLRQYGCVDPIEIIGDETFAPYQRPPLSKTWLQDNVAITNILLRPEAFYKAQNIKLTLGARVVELDRLRHTVTLSSGAQRPYRKLILALGARIRRLTIPGHNLQGVHYLRSVNDANGLKRALLEGQRLVIIGGGYIGLEVAAAARSLGKDVLVVEREARLLERVASTIISDFYLQYHRRNGVEILLNMQASAFEGSKGRIEGLRLSDGRCVVADAVLIGIGALAHDQIARQSGLHCQNGIVVDLRAQTSDPDIYAIGDCTQRPLFPCGGSGRLESVANAVEQAKQAASAICGRPPLAPEAPWFWSDQFDLRLQIAGLALNIADTAVRGNVDDAKFAVVHFGNDAQIRLVEAVNFPAEFAAARSIITRRAMSVSKELQENAPSL